jgi:hypothetical protein
MIGDIGLSFGQRHDPVGLCAFVLFQGQKR